MGPLSELTKPVRLWNRRLQPNLATPTYLPPLELNNVSVETAKLLEFCFLHLQVLVNVSGVAGRFVFNEHAWSITLEEQSPGSGRCLSQNICHEKLHVGLRPHVAGCIGRD